MRRLKTLVEGKKPAKKIGKKPNFRMASRGLTIVYTGEGKGKTTAALGLVLRSVGYKKKVLIYQFGKIWFSGEVKGVEKLKPNVKLVQGGISFVGILDDVSPFSDHVREAQKMFDKLYREVVANKWDIVVADEVIGAVAGKLIKQEQLIKLIEDKPDRLDLVLTGHHAKKSLYKYADLVTEMIEIKHPYQKGILAKPGIDY